MSDDNPKLVNLRPAPTAENVRKLLDFTRAEMDAGKVQAVALVTIYRNGGTRSQWAMEDGTLLAAMLGEIAALQHDFAVEMAELRGPPEVTE